MTFLGLVSDGVFCQDFGDLTVRFVGQETSVKFTVSDADGNQLSSFEEIYYPNADDEIIIAGLSDVISSYLEGEKLSTLFNPNQGCTEISSFVTLKIEFYQSGNKVDACSQVFYQSLDRTRVYPVNYNYFLSRFRKRKVYEDQAIMLSYIYRGQTLKANVAYYDANSASCRRTITLDNSHVKAGRTALHQYLPSDIAAQCSVTQASLIYVEFSLIMDGKVIDYMKCTFDHGHLRQRTSFLFKNLFGVPEVLVLTGEDKLTSEMEGAFAWIGRKYKKVSTELTAYHTISTGYIDRDTFSSVEDAIRSDEVHIVDGASIKDMATVTSIDYSDKTPNDSPREAFVTYRISNKAQEMFSRVGVKAGEIFDDTFDETFE